MNAFFKELGREVGERWKKRDFALAAFPEIARAALEKRPPATHVDLEELVREFLLDDEQVFQTQSGFGQPELVVYDDPRFYIQVLFWLEGTTDVHQHEFSGAFHVMQGSSIHAAFAFEKPKPVSVHLRLGELRMKGIQLLETGATVPIVSGGAHIHSLFHLDTPSVSVVVRTHHDPGTGPQFTYLPPHVAVDPVPHDALTMRRMQLLDVLERIADPSYPDLVRTMLEELDFERGFFILQNGMGHLKELEEWEASLAVFEKKHGAAGRLVAPTLEEILRRDILVTMRRTVTAVEHRCFMALLLSGPSRKEILRLVSARYPGDAVETILGWAAELGDVDGFSTGILDAEFPAEVDVPEEDQVEVFLAVFGHFLKGGKEGGKARLKFNGHAFSAADLRAFRAALEKSALRPLVME